jgi:hypothetical protein
VALNRIPIQPDAARDAKARELAKTAHTWNVVTLKQDWGAFKKGDQARQTPNGYRVNAVFCECSDYATWGNVCKHIRAFCLWESEMARPGPQPRTANELIEHFWSKVDKNGPTPTHQPGLGACWIWLGSRKENGYGQCYVNRRPIYAHRFAYEHAVGPLTDGLRALHRCDNPPCVRPDHLFAGTQSDNTKDAIQKGRANPAANLPIRTVTLVEQARIEDIDHEIELAFMALATSKRGAGAGAAIIKRYEDIFGADE